MVQEMGWPARKHREKGASREQERIVPTAYVGGF
jgi:hypothetical protein